MAEGKLREAENAKVFKEGRYWTWHHRCLDRPVSTPVNGHPAVTWDTAHYYARQHMKRCL